MHWSKGKRVISVLIAAMFVAGIGLGLSCTKKTGDVNAVANPEYVKPIGHVQGKVVDRCSDLSLADVEVSMAIKGSIKSFTTDDNGLFAFQNLPVNYGDSSPSTCYVVVANFAKYNKKNADAVAKWNKKNPSDLHIARPYPDTVEGEVCLFYEWREAASSEGVVNYTGSGAVTIVDGLAGGLVLYASKPVGTVVGEAYWGKDKSPASGVVLNLYGEDTLEGQAVVGADGTYQFSMVHECLGYYIASAKPCFEYANLGSGSGTYKGEYFDVLATQLSDPEGDLAVTNVKCIELNPIPCLDKEDPCLIASTPTEKQDLTDASPTITLTFSELMDETLPVKEEVEILFTGYKAVSLIPPSVDFDFAWSTAVVNMEGYPTAQTVSVLSLTPTEDLMLGMKYDIKLDGTGNLMYKFQDLAGNAYDPASPVCLVHEATNGDSKISITTNYGGTCPKVTLLAQVAKTANAITATGPTYLDKNAPKSLIQGPVLNADYWNPAAADYATEYVTDQAVLSWTAPGSVSDPVRVKGYRLYARVNSMDPWTQVAYENTLGPYANYWPAKSVLDNTTNLTAIQAALASGGIEQLSDVNWGYDKTGKAAQTLQLAVTTVNGDGYECPEITSDNSVTLKDNTIPMAIRNLSFSVNPLSRGLIDTAYFSNSVGPVVYDTITLSSLVYPTSGIPTAWTPGLMACNYGDLPLAIPILEDVDSTTVTGVTFSDTSTNSLLGICQLTFCSGWYTEPNDATDGTLVQTLGPKLVDSKGKNFIVLVWNNAYKLDTGDRLIIPGVRDIAGNIVPAYSATTGIGGGWVHVVDDIPPMMKSVKVNVATDTLTVVTTEKVPAGAPDDGTNQANLLKFALNHFTNNTAGAPALSSAKEDAADSLSDGVCADGFCNGYSIVPGTTDESTITIYLNDVSFINPGDFIHLDGLTDDAWKDSARASNASTDPGTWAYWYGKPTEPGAYDPDAVSGLGTRTSFSDQNYNIIGTTTPNPNRAFGIPPRLHPSAPGLPAAPPYAKNTAITITSVDFTENLDNPADVPTAWVTYDPNRPANWTVGIHDCGPDSVCANADDVVQAQPCTVTAVAQTTPTREFSITCTTPNPAGANTYSFTAAGGSSISVSNVRDVRGNIITAHNSISYDANLASWVRN